MSDLQVEKDLMKIVIDSETPINTQLSAKYKWSFAYPSMKDRAPVVLTKVIDYLARDKKAIVEKYGPEVKEELKCAIGELSELKNHLQTSKQFELFVSSDPDTPFWNDHLRERKEKNEINNYYESDWLFAECYLYRRIREAFATKCLLNSLDPFSVQKTKILCDAVEVVNPFFHHLYEDRIMDKSAVLSITELRNELAHILKWCLWANRLDLSFTSNKEPNKGTEGFSCLENWDKNIILDDSPSICSMFADADNTKKVVDIVMDNAGLEMLCDLTLADFLISRCGVGKINFHIKPIPWYVSDVIHRDFNQGVESIACSQFPHYSEMGKRWKKYLNSEKWSVYAETFWCLGLPFQYMKETDPSLYERLTNSSLIIFKGDLNYRKLVRDINWIPTTPFSIAIDPFHPAPLVALRTLKADTVCGLNKGQAENLKEEKENWLVSGEYGMIQFDCTKEKQCS